MVAFIVFLHRCARIEATLRTFWRYYGDKSELLCGCQVFGGLDPSDLQKKPWNLKKPIERVFRPLLWVFESIKCSKAVFEDASGLEVLCVLHLPSFELPLLWILLFDAKWKLYLGYWCCPEREHDKGGIQSSLKWFVSFDNENKMQRNGE